MEKWVVANSSFISLRNQKLRDAEIKALGYQTQFALTEKSHEETIAKYKRRIDKLNDELHLVEQK